MRTLIILGSSRKDGDTKKVVDNLIEISGWDMIDLNDYQFSYFDYEHLNIDDDFIPLMRKVTDEYDVIIFATPVYWYSMSGIMKVFFDRISDLLSIEKDIGRKLRMKSMAVISCSEAIESDSHFWIPFRKSAEYLGMKYLANVHVSSTGSNNDIILDFVNQVEKTV